MPCEECRELVTHEFRSPDDLIHAVRVAAEDVDRGVLRRIAADTQGDIVHYRFLCQVCGDRFNLFADTYHGRGRWTREEGKE